MHTPSAPFPAALIFGAPGAGKGTQGDILRCVPGFFHISSGTVFRQLDPSTPEGQTVRDFTHRGELVPDDLTVRLFVQWLEERRATGQFRPVEHLLLLDGIPRRPAQCDLIRPLIDVRLVLHLICRDEHLMIARIRRRAQLENRHDDVSDDVIRRRLEIYRRETAPVLSRYPPQLIREVEPMMTQAEVLLACLQHLVPVYKQCFPGVVPGAPGAPAE
jgi:adenylate kinase